MATEPTITALDVLGARQSWAVRFFAAASDYWALTKPEVNFLILITTWAGFYLGSQSRFNGFSSGLLLATLLGTFLVASGAATLNQCVECRFDAQMRRTARRPLAAGRLDPAAVLCFGILLSAGGALYLAVAVNSLASLLAVFTLASYLFLYTPLKRKTPLCVLVGAVPGAVPPLIGWVAARGRLDTMALVLYAMVFFWQFPHFMAIAWMYREDYARAGYLVLPLGEHRDRFVIWQSLVFSLVLIPFSLIPAIEGESGPVYFAGALGFGLIFSYFSGRFALQRSNAAARRLLAASIVYLPATFLSMMLNKK